MRFPELFCVREGVDQTAESSEGGRDDAKQRDATLADVRRGSELGRRRKRRRRVGPRQLCRRSTWKVNKERKGYQDAFRGPRTGAATTLAATATPGRSIPDPTDPAADLDFLFCPLARRSLKRLPPPVFNDVDGSSAPPTISPRPPSLFAVHLIRPPLPRRLTHLCNLPLTTKNVPSPNPRSPIMMKGASARMTCRIQTVEWKSVHEGSSPPEAPKTNLHERDTCGTRHG